MDHITQKDIDTLISQIDKLTHHLELMKEEYAKTIKVSEQRPKPSKKMGNIESCFFEAEINQLNNDMEDMDYGDLY
jgi:hypothetical protein|tara:strand:- start:170 stop:397 length:228 start_codon:yes stop_codon:yes gene_type:complete